MNSQLRDRIARAIVAEFPPRSQPDNDDFAEALRYADAALGVLSEPNERGVVMERYPYEEGDVIVLGPEVFATKDYKVICWQGHNYVLVEDGE